MKLLKTVINWLFKVKFTDSKNKYQGAYRTPAVLSDKETKKIVKKEKSKRKIFTMRFECFLERLVLVTIYLVALVLVCWAGYAVYRSSKTSAAATFCYISHQSDTFDLRGNIEWEQDRTIGEFKTFDEAADAAKKINCPLEGR